LARSRSCQSLRYHRHLHSFPTRRSSDLCIELVQPPAVSVALQGEAIMITFPVCPKARLASFPACAGGYPCGGLRIVMAAVLGVRSEEHTSELQSRENLVCRLLLEKKNTL